MAQIRPPEELLYAFSQWLQQWAEYARLQAQLSSTSAVSDDPAQDRSTAERHDAHLEQPPAHWLELMPSAPPAHWLALFEAYGLEPPATGEPHENRQVGSQIPGAAPRPLQEWLGEFQRGLAQFTNQSVEPEHPALPRATSGESENLAADRMYSSYPEDNSLPKPPDTQLMSRKVQGAGDRANLLSPGDELPAPQSYVAQQSDRPLADSYSRTNSNPSPATEGTEDVVAASPAAQFFSPMADAVPLVNPTRNEGRRALHQTASETIEELPHDPVETTATSVRLNLNPRPTIEAVPSPSIVRPAQAVPRLLIGVPASVGQPLATSAAPVVASSRAEDSQQEERPAEANLVPEIDLDALSSLIKWRDEVLKSMSSRESQNEQAPLEWSQPVADRWPELPERPAPVQPPSNVLANPVHRMRIAREQKGRSWNG